MFGLSVSEILLISVIALVLFGNEKLPENIKKLAKGASKAKSILFDVNYKWQEIKEDIKKNIDFEDEKQQLRELTKPIEIISQEDELNLRSDCRIQHKNTTEQLSSKTE